MRAGWQPDKGDYGTQSDICQLGAQPSPTATGSVILIPSTLTAQRQA